MILTKTIHRITIKYFFLLSIKFTHTKIPDQKLLYSSIYHVLGQLYPQGTPLTRAQFLINLSKISVSPINNTVYDLNVNHSIIKLLFGNVKITRGDLYNIMLQQNLINNKLSLWPQTGKEFTSILASQEYYLSSLFSQQNQISQTVILPTNKRFFDPILSQSKFWQDMQKMTRQPDFDSISFLNPQNPLFDTI